MRCKYTTLPQKITQDVNTINLPRSSIHDAYVLKFNMRLLNSTGTSVTPTIKSILQSIPEISLVSDSTRIHYRLNGYDLALLNARIQPTQTNAVLGKTFSSLADEASQNVEFTLEMDEGDIVAVAHTNVEMHASFADTTSEGLTVLDASCTVTILENLLTTAELYERYGTDLRGVAEPKVYTIEAPLPASTDFIGCLDLPTGTLVRGAIVQITNGSNVTPTNVGLLRTVPDRVELMNIDYPTMRALDEIIYKTTFPAGVINLNYGSQWQKNGQGKDGWSYSKGDVVFAAKTNTASTVRYTSIESLVDVALYKSAFVFTEY